MRERLNSENSYNNREEGGSYPEDLLKEAGLSSLAEVGLQVRLRQIEDLCKIVENEKLDFLKRFKALWRLSLLMEQLRYTEKFLNVYEIKVDISRGKNEGEMGKYVFRIVEAPPEREKRLKEEGKPFSERIKELSFLDLDNNFRLVVNQFPYVRGQLLLVLKNEKGVETNSLGGLEDEGIIEKFLALIKDEGKNVLKNYVIGINSIGAGLSQPFFHAHLLPEKLFPLLYDYLDDKGEGKEEDKGIFKCEKYRLDNEEDVRRLKERINAIKSKRDEILKVSEKDKIEYNKKCIEKYKSASIPCYNAVVVPSKNVLLLFEREGGEKFGDKLKNILGKNGIGFAELLGTIVIPVSAPKSKKLDAEKIKEFINAVEEAQENFEKFFNNDSQ